MPDVLSRIPHSLHPVEARSMMEDELTPLHGKLLADYETRQFERNLRSIERGVTLDTYFYKKLSDPSPEGGQLVDFGDVDIQIVAREKTNEAYCDDLLAVLGCKDKNGRQATFGSVWEEARSSAEDSPSVTLLSGDGEELTVNFYAGKDRPVLNMKIWDLKEPAALKAAAERYEGRPPYSWINLLQQELHASKAHLTMESSGDVDVVATGIPYIDLETNNTILSQFLDNLSIPPNIANDISGVIDQTHGGEPRIAGKFKANHDKEGNVVDIEIATETPGLYLVLEGPAVTFGKESPVQTVRSSLRVRPEEMKQGEVAHPFLRSETCREMLSAFSEAGLSLSERLVEAVSEKATSNRFSHRYGNGYADFTRKLCSFIATDPEDCGAQIFTEAPSAEQISSMQQSLEGMQSGTAKLAIELMLNLMSRRGPQPGEAVRQLHKSGSSLKDGGCKDVEAYFIGTARSNPEDMSEDETFISKYSGKYTSVNKVPLNVNGVRIPPGFVMRVDKSSGTVEPMRPTMFCFSEQDAADAYGDQYDEVVGPIV